MATDPNEPEEIDAETLEAFSKILKKAGPEWLKEQMKELTPPKSAENNSNSNLTVTLEGYLRDELKATREEMSLLKEAWDLLTPEQKTQLKSARSAGQNPLPKQSEKQEEKPAPKKKLGFL